MPNRNETKKKKVTVRSIKPGSAWNTSITNKNNSFECSLCTETIFQKKHEATLHYIENHLEDPNEFEGWIHICYCFIFYFLNNLYTLMLSKNRKKIFTTSNLV